jgi:hypothetical protein
MVSNILKFMPFKEHIESPWFRARGRANAHGKEFSAASAQSMLA